MTKMHGSVDRFTVIAYVCDDGGVYLSHHEGSTEFRQIVYGNNHSCRYAVVRILTEVRAYDLNEILFGEFYEPYPGPYKVYPTADAAIMACALIDHSK